MREIPKTIHYFWFGHNEKPEIVRKCIESWKKYMPEYEIIEWNEDNYDVRRCKYARQAYESKKWAFVSDYARFDILSRLGGIYLDTDVELLRPVPAEMLRTGNAVAGMESTGCVAPGLIFAAWKDHPFCRKMVESYEKDLFIKDGRQNLLTVNRRACGILEREGFNANNKKQTVMQTDIYPSEYFCGFDQDLREYDITEKTVAVHHYASSWKNAGIKRRIQNAVKKVFGINGYRKVLTLKRKLFGTYSK